MLRHTRFAALLALAAATLTPAAALAGPAPAAGINIRWDNCSADGGVVNKAFACNTNTGAELAVMSVRLDSGMQDVSGMEIRVSLKSTSPPLPAWWTFRRGPLASDGCRPTSLSFIAQQLNSSANCADLGNGQQIGGVGGYHVDELGPGSAVVLIAEAVPSQLLVPLDAGTEYFIGALRIDNAKTVGTGACGGCDIPVCILFTSLNITTPVLGNDRLFTQGANGATSQVIRWQNGTIANLVNQCTGTFNCNTQFDCLVGGPTAARRSTWGEVKSLYR